MHEYARNQGLQVLGFRVEKKRILCLFRICRVKLRINITSAVQHSYNLYTARNNEIENDIYLRNGKLNNLFFF